MSCDSWPPLPLEWAGRIQSTVPRPQTSRAPDSQPMSAILTHMVNTIICHSVLNGHSLKMIFFSQSYPWLSLKNFKRFPAHSKPSRKQIC